MHAVSTNQIADILHFNDKYISTERERERERARERESERERERRYTIHVSLLAHRQISKKRCFGKYCSCDKTCQFSALQGAPRRSYLENLTIDDKLINKRVRLFIHQTCV